MTKETHDTPVKMTLADTPAPATVEPTTNTNSLAVASLVLGIVSFTGFGLVTGVPAIVTGIMAIKRGQKERSMSIAGIILGSVATLFTLLLIGLAILIVTLGIMSESSYQQDSFTPGYSEQIESSRT